ncbi:bifunctional metallophosphatase/5'-nucleotidase [Pseudoflavonifractor phocaeensis]|uniref:bifunctional metallophosphatase/5'-nucleotidase n=1 Tax=Pseudoflavonifractor phocaeensis TaxID=1870988 RepID=UPI00195C122F|nr:bifunctional UDP-sugar hydrolase/5'-nucleotidase [Pseudoflavonifractor phocaeensis]MBM6939193.1 bifunctional metallophosphatase/5'-nucleotidase [Pseudoflavonifractor phocaeensis]
MGKMTRILCALLACTLLLGSVPALAAESAPPLTILFTHDTHDHWYPEPTEDGTGTYGGYTRLATVLKREREEADNAVITVDGGDFSMGSLIQTIYSEEAPELRALGALGYDVTTLGNHEFDYRADGLAKMLNAAKASGEVLPAIVQANYTTPLDPEAGAAVTQALADYPVTSYTVIEREGLRIGVFGVLGEDADECAPMSGMALEPIVDAAKRVVEELEEQEDPDYIICLSHSGTENGKGEDVELAKKVDGIDVIISGHTHTVLEEPIAVNDTLIVSCGPYTENLGVLTVEKGTDGLALLDYRLVALDDGVEEDSAMTAMADSFQELVGETYLKDYGMTYDQVLADNPYIFTAISALGLVQEEERLGNLIADSYVYAVQEAEGTDYVPVDFAVVPSGVIRATLPQGAVTTADAFNILSLGIGADGTPGYPLISVYLTGAELKDAFEVDASVTPLMPAAQLYGAGMQWSFNTHRMIFDKVTGCAQILPDGSTAEIEDDRLYRVVADLYTGQMLGAVNAQSFGLLTITPRDESGAPLEDLESRIIQDQNGAEVKAWYALAGYLRSMGTVDSRYSGPEGRKVVSDSWNPVELVSHPRLLTVIVWLVLLLVVVLAVFLIVRLTGGQRRRKGYGRRSRRGYRSYRG